MVEHALTLGMDVNELDDADGTGLSYGRLFIDLKRAC
jgi:hypothetical protein